jgi:hypothetical protein
MCTIWAIIVLASVRVSDAGTTGVNGKYLMLSFTFGKYLL